MGFAGFQQFEARLRATAAQDVPQLTVVAVKKIAIGVYADLVRASPVDTGRFRGSWTCALDAPDTAVLPEAKKGAEVYPPPDESQVTQALEGLQPFGNAWISNNLPYAEVLNEGHSRQAPAKFVEAVLATHATQIGE
jgi:hypothetical protein